MSESLRGKAPEELTPYEAVLRSFGYGYRRTPEEHAAVQAALERAVEEAPRYADGWATLALNYVYEEAHEFNLRPDPIGRALEAAQRAADASPSNTVALDALAWARFFRKEFQAFRTAVEKCVELNPLNSPTLAGLGALTAYAGDWESGCALVERALELNPRHPGWYWLPLFYDAYRRGEYRDSVDIALKINLPGFFVMHEALAAAYGQLGERDAAANALQEMLRLKPDYPSTGRERLEKWFNAEFVEHLMDGLKKAGLDIATGVRPKGATPTEETSGPAASMATSIAVLPFVNRSDDADNEYFSDGLTEELIADLAGIKALSVISRTSAMLFKGTDKDLPTIGRELGVRYVLEGSVRKAGSSLRITAQLVDAEKDTPLWSEKYSGAVDEVFEVQERVSREIVRALDVTLTSDENHRLAERPIADARAFELYLQARQEIRRIEGNALERAAKLLSQAIEIEGETPPLLFLTALAKVAQVKAGVNPDLRQLDEAEAQALTLLEHTPDLPQAHALLGSIGYERGRLPEAVWHCKRALEGTSNDGDALLYLGASYTAAGQTEQALDTGRRMVALDPLASISWMVLGAAHWFVGRPDEALPDLKRSLELDPQNFFLHWTIGYTYATLGRLAEAGRHAAICHDAGPDTPYTRQLLSLIDGLEGRREAALERLADIDVTPLDAHNKFHLAEPFAMAGDTDRALEVVEIAVNQGFYPFPFINEYCPFMAPLRSLPEFAKILAKSKEKTEAFREDGPLRPYSQEAPGGTK